MNKNYWVRVGWVWALAIGWIAWLSYDTYKTYTWHEATLALPLVVTLTAVWILIFRKGKLWVRIGLVIVALALWGTVGRFGGRALGASGKFRHYDANSVSKVEVFALEEAPNTKRGLKEIQQITLSEGAELHRDGIRRIINAFHTVRPCWRSASPASGKYRMQITDRDSKGLMHIIFLCDPLVSPPTARVLIPWSAPFTGERMFTEYESAELYQELKRAGMR